MSNKDRKPYEVGYRKPPESHQFKPGQSGNRKGRPKGARNFETELREELNRTITIKEGGRLRNVTKRQGILMRLSKDALEGKNRAAEILIKWVLLFGTNDEGEAGRRLASDDRAILERYLAAAQAKETASDTDDDPEDDQ